MKLAYVYMSDEVFNKYQAAITACGWQGTYLFNQFLSSFAGRNLDYYRQVLATAAAAMNLEQAKLYNLLRSPEEPELPNYAEAMPNYGTSPLASVVNVTANQADKRRLGRFKCSGRNAVVLRLAALVERQSSPLTLSRIIDWHLSEYWEKIYAPQLENDFNSKL